jgi:hypothetical protein
MRSAVCRFANPLSGSIPIWNSPALPLAVSLLFSVGSHAELAPGRAETSETEMLKALRHRYSDEKRRVGVLLVRKVLPLRLVIPGFLSLLKIPIASRLFTSLVGTSSANSALQ